MSGDKRWDDMRSVLSHAVAYIEEYVAAAVAELRRCIGTLRLRLEEKDTASWKEVVSQIQLPLQLPLQPDTITVT